MHLIKAGIAVIVVSFSLIFLWNKYSYFGSKTGLDGQAKYLVQLEQDGAPDFSIPDLEGKSYQFKSTKADLIILNFWATWCAPCVTEYPAMLRMVEHFGGKVVLVAVSLDEDRKDLDSFLRIYGKGSQHIVHLWNPENTVSKGFGTTKLPETFIFDANFKLIRKVPGQEEWDAPYALEYLEQLMEERK